MAPITKKLKKKRRPADRDSSDGEDEPEAPAAPLPVAVKKKRAKSDAEVAPEAKKAKVEEETKAAPKKAKGKKEETKEEKKDAASKDGSKDAADKVSDAEKEALTKAALALIEEGLSQKDAQKGGKAFIPSNWHSKFKPVLGKYRKFLNAQHGYVAIDTDGGNFIVKRASEAGDEATPANGKWKKLLYNAWIGYCEAVPKAERDFQKFISELPGRGSKSSPEGSAKSKGTASPQVSPKAAPTEPKPTLKAKKKLKKKTATP